MKQNKRQLCDTNHVIQQSDFKFSSLKHIFNLNFDIFNFMVGI